MKRVIIFFLLCGCSLLPEIAFSQNEQSYEYGILVPPANLGGKTQTDYIFVVQDNYEIVNASGPFKDGIGHWHETGLNSYHTIVSQMNSLGKEGWEPYLILGGAVVFRRTISK